MVLGLFLEVSCFSRLLTFIYLGLNFAYVLNDAFRVLRVIFSPVCILGRLLFPITVDDPSYEFLLLCQLCIALGHVSPGIPDDTLEIHFSLRLLVIWASLYHMLVALELDQAYCFFR